MTRSSRIDWPELPPGTEDLELAGSELFGPGAEFRIAWMEGFTESDPAAFRERQHRLGQQLSTELRERAGDSIHSSRANSGPLIIAGIAPARPEAVGLGIDVEARSRELTPEVLRRIRGPGEGGLPI